MSEAEFVNDVAGPKGHTQAFDLATIGVLVDIGLVSHKSTMVRKIRTRNFVAGPSDYVVNAADDVAPALVKRIEGRTGDVKHSTDPDGFINKVIGPTGSTRELSLDTIITLIQLGLVRHVATTVWNHRRRRFSHRLDLPFKAHVPSSHPEWKGPVA